MGHRKEAANTTRKRAIRQYCIECSGNNRAEVRRCEITNCPLWIYRMGKEVPLRIGQPVEDAPLPSETAQNAVENEETASAG